MGSAVPGPSGRQGSGRVRAIPEGPRAQLNKMRVSGSQGPKDGRVDPWTENHTPEYGLGTGDSERIPA